MSTFKKIAFVLGLFCAAFLSTGCRGTVPVYNVESNPTAVGSTVSLKDISKTIKSTGTFLGWQMREVNPGSIVGTLHLRKHIAKVDISFDTETYSIQYKHSVNLEYDGTNIHSNYNGWIQRLDRAIAEQLSVL